MQTFMKGKREGGGSNWNHIASGPLVILEKTVADFYILSIANILPHLSFF